jgi:beta-galactosidase GanA
MFREKEKTKTAVIYEGGLLRPRKAFVVITLGVTALLILLPGIISQFGFQAYTQGTKSFSSAQLLSSGGSQVVVGASIETFAYNPSTIQSTIATMAANGVTGVRLFIAWSTVEPSPGEYQTATIVAGVKTALSHNMTIVLNLNDHAVPSWFVTKYAPNFVTNQTGGYVDNWDTVTPSLSDPLETHEWFNVVGNISQTISNNFGANPKIVIDVTNEDHYTNIVREVGDYSPSTVGAWQSWLSQKFGNNIQNFNAAFGGSYTSFDSIAPPTDTSNPQLWYYWRDFNSLMIQNFQAVAAHVARTYYSGPIMITMMPMFMLGTGASAGPLPTLYNSSDINIIGINFFPKGLNETDLLTSAIDEMRSLYPGKQIWISEINTLTGAYEPNVMTTWFEQSVAHGISGFFWWDWYDPTLQNRWGLVDSSGAPRSQAFNEFKSIAAMHLTSVPLTYFHPKVAVLVSDPSIIEAWPDGYLTAGEMSYGFNYYLNSRNVSLGYVTEDMVLQGKLSQYTVLILAGYKFANSSVIKAITNWVRNGGILVGDADAGLYNNFKPDNYLRGGLAEVFGAYDVSQQPMYWQNAGRFTLNLTNNNSEQSASNTDIVVSAYGKEEDLRAGPNTLILGTWQDGKAAIIEHFYYLGRTFYIGTYLGVGTLYAPPGQVQNYWMIMDHLLSFAGLTNPSSSSNAPLLSANVPNIGSMDSGTEKNITIQVSYGFTSPDVLLIENSFANFGSSTQNINYCFIHPTAIITPFSCRATMTAPNVQSTGTQSLQLKVESLAFGQTAEVGKNVTVDASGGGLFGHNGPPLTAPPSSWLVPVLIAVVVSSAILFTVAAARTQRKRNAS